MPEQRADPQLTKTTFVVCINNDDKGKYLPPRWCNQLEKATSSFFEPIEQIQNVLQSVKNTYFLHWYHH